MKVTYLIAGGGLAAYSCAKGIRSVDKTGDIRIIGDEPELPYHRPPLTKSLWSGKKKVADIFVEKDSFYSENGISIDINTTVTDINPVAKTVKTSFGAEITYDKLMIATGGRPRRFSIPGGDNQEVCYYRYLSDFRYLESHLSQNSKVVVIGGGFIGSELAASLAARGVKTTFIFPENYICRKVLPADLGHNLIRHYINNGVTVDSEDIPVAFIKKNGKTIIRTRKGLDLEADLIVAGLGIEMNIDLARKAKLEASMGIVVNEFLQTSDPAIFAAGDIALFPYAALGKRMRVEHWDNAQSQGFIAGKNMVALMEPYTYMPYFFSDLFESGYEAVGDVNSELEMISDWKEEYQKGVIYYLQEGHVRGVLLFNIWDRTDTARQLIRSSASKADLKGAI